MDNVDLACNEDDMVSYVSGLGVEVFTCFKTNPRRRPTETEQDVADRRAFRLCVNETDRNRLLDSNNWPHSIRVSDWFFRTNKDDQPADDGKRRRVGSPADVGQSGRDVDVTADVIASQRGSSTGTSNVDRMDTNDVAVAAAQGHDLEDSRLEKSNNDDDHGNQKYFINMAAVRELYILSYNMHGFNQGLSVVEDLT